MQPQDDFRIGVCFETHPARLQLGAQLAIVIDFPVVGEHEATIPGLHWLLAAAQIDDTEPPVTQPNAIAKVVPGFVWPSMGQAIAHGEQNALITAFALQIKSDYSTHLLTAPSPRAR